MRRLRARLARADAPRVVARARVDVFMGRAEFIGEDEVEVNGASGDRRRLRFRHAVIATGAAPALPAIPGLRGATFATHETIFDVETLPRRLAIIGGGPAACELAQAFAIFGSHVTVTARSGLLPREDADAVAAVRRELEADGVEIVTDVEYVRVDAEPGKPVGLVIRETNALYAREVSPSGRVSREPVRSEARIE